jgi:hypothetical protein
VGGNVWSITFNSNKWVDPRDNHDSYIAGNWKGNPTTWSDTWGSGYSKAWGQNVGDQSLIECISTSLYVTNEAMFKDCRVEEVVKGTAPLNGNFQLILNTTTHNVINFRGGYTTVDIAHNAFALASETGSDGSSLQEKLEALDNIGRVNVTRSAVNPYTVALLGQLLFCVIKIKMVDILVTVNKKIQLMVYVTVLEMFQS